MEWLNNASTITTLVLSIFGIGGYIIGIVSYLKDKASPTRRTTTGSSPASASTAQKSPVQYSPITWIEWIEIFAQGFVDMAKFILTFMFHDESDRDFII